jgi:two-component sensor histidine kinase
MRVPLATASAALVRHRISADLAAHGVSPDSIDEVILVASELIGNAVRHTRPSGGQDLGVDWTLDPAGVTVQVSDFSPALPAPRRPDATETSGRGLRVVDALCDDWGTRATGAGKQVWAHLPAHPPASGAG